ncbi:hypothetical protein CIW52_03255 [Mycolicibacterium sp. P9-64]|uniref:hypothetical protein n=1 Tax=Mycolicibacterium sp. P9-64 TaxID=2024612 RepID=UPI0011ED38DA|nr:hypothetical protein [Mycolicibacterium sp. P9-64]KAA0086916.1 hypothetical protein CIW52_03255 [Mycolicibacterium sp. P9-64]
MTTRSRAIIELVLGAAALIGAVLCWLAAKSTAEVAPVIAGEPAKTSNVYDPTLIASSLLLATVAGVLLVIGVTHWRRVA